MCREILVLCNMINGLITFAQLLKKYVSQAQLE